MPARKTLLILCLLVAACGDKGGPDVDSGGEDSALGNGSGGEGADSGGADGGESGGGDAGGGSGSSSSDQPPTMTAADAYCYQHETGEPFWSWVVSGQADDPQGIDTLEAIVPEGVVVRVDGTERARLPFACSDTGACSASFGETEAGATCADAARTTFELTALDEDGNRSDPAVATGRQGP